MKKQPRKQEQDIGSTTLNMDGNPAVSMKPVAFRPCLATGSALTAANYIGNFTYVNHGLYKMTCAVN
jgi:hypothetical protein